MPLRCGFHHQIHRFFFPVNKNVEKAVQWGHGLPPVFVQFPVVIPRTILSNVRLTFWLSIHSGKVLFPLVHDRSGIEYHKNCFTPNHEFNVRILPVKTFGIFQEILQPLQFWIASSKFLNPQPKCAERFLLKKFCSVRWFWQRIMERVCLKCVDEEILFKNPF